MPAKGATSGTVQEKIIRNTMPVLEKVQRGVPFTTELHGGRNSVVNGTPRSSIQFHLNTLFSDFLVGITECF